MSSPAGSPDCKRRKLAGDVKSVAEMSNVSPKKDDGTPTDDVTNTTSASNTASNKKSIINKDANTFKDVARLDGFVDRTMLIQALLENKRKKVMIFAPSKFGKTINLDMIRFFCDIEDKNTKTKEDVAKKPSMDELRATPSEKMKVLLRKFNDKQENVECLILKEEDIVEEHFGRHPVILFDFKDWDCTSINHSDAVYECAKCMRKSYLENQYLKKSKEFQSDDCEHTRLKKKCIKWCDYEDDPLRDLSEGDVKDALKDLVKSLRMHWGRKPVFLVDEIDKPCVAALRNKLDETEIQRIRSVVSNVVCSIFKEGKTELKLEAALFTGIARFKNVGMSFTNASVKTFFLGDDRFSKYYGLTTQEVKSLVRKFFDKEEDAAIETIIEDIKANYNGYYQHPSSDAKEESKEYARYCIFSVLSYLQKGNESTNVSNLNFWTERDDLIEELVSLLKKSVIIMMSVQKLLFEDSGTIPIMYEEKVCAEHLREIYCPEIKPNPDTIFNFFLQRGFLAHNPEKPEEVPGGWKIHVRIPNLEIKDMYQAMFKKYYDETLPEDVKLAFTSCGEFFKSLPTVLESSMLNLTKFQEDLNELCVNLKCIFRHMNCEGKRSVCCFMVTILKIYAGYDKAEMEYKTQYFDTKNEQKNVYIDVWGKHGNFALILEAKHNESANGEPGRIGSKTKSSLAAAENIVTFLPGNEPPDDDKFIGKAGTGRNLEVLKSSNIKNYLLVGLAVDGDGTTHMLVFPNSDKWENVIAVNPEHHVAEMISAHQKSK